MVVWDGYHLEESTWELETNFPDKAALRDDIESGRFLKSNSEFGEQIHLREGAVVRFSRLRYFRTVSKQDFFGK